MKSKAHIKGHPLHPILIVFPIAFFIGAFIVDVVAALNESTVYWQLGKYLELGGIIGALAAAIPGIIDFVYTVPPKSSAKSRAAKHGLLNTTMLLLFIGAFFFRQNESSFTIIAIEAVGVILLSIAGWMGGTLVYRNQIGVDPRYANAGKWKESYFGQSSGLVEVADLNELQPDQMKLLHFADKRVVLGKTANGYVAFNDRCTHKGASLAGGSMISGTVQCPWHGSQFDTESGAVKAGPACDGISVYKVEERDGKVYLQLDS
jgi:uncharacterized membrane protein/nitrite reductase/ring-hydroxylating ferredoxin subunit